MIYVVTNERKKNDCELRIEKEMEGTDLSVGIEGNHDEF
jgi:hypothetical protein